MYRKALILAAIALSSVAGSQALALNIKVIDSGVAGHGMVAAAKNQLTALGHTLTAGGTLADYSAFDQVWDLRYNGVIGAADVLAMGSYLADGGRMYFTGEHSGFDSRNNSLVSFLNTVTGESLSLLGGASGLQSFTSAGLAVNAPNALGGVNFAAARTVNGATVGSGFLVTTTGSNAGSLVGWDFGAISADSRVLVGFDIEIFSNGQNLTENMSVFLGAAAAEQPAGVPDAGNTLALLGLGLVSIAAIRRRKTA